MSPSLSSIKASGCCRNNSLEQSECSMKSFLTLFLTALIDGQHYPFKHRLPLTFTTRAGFKWHLRALVSQKETMTMTMTTGSERLIRRFPSTGPGAEQYMENSLCTATSCSLSFPPLLPPPPGAHQQHSQQQQQEHLDIFTSDRC